MFVGVNTMNQHEGALELKAGLARVFNAVWRVPPEGFLASPSQRTGEAFQGSICGIRKNILGRDGR